MFTKGEVDKIRKKINRENDKAFLAFAALGDPGRLKIFKILMEYRDVCVTDVAKVFAISVPAASQQLKILEAGGLTRRIRMGQMVCYEINVENPLVKMLIGFLRKEEKGRS